VLRPFFLLFFFLSLGLGLVLLFFLLEFILQGCVSMVGICAETNELQGSILRRHDDQSPQLTY